MLLRSFCVRKRGGRLFLFIRTGVKIPLRTGRPRIATCHNCSSCSVRSCGAASPFWAARTSARVDHMFSNVPPQAVSGMDGELALHH